MRFLLPHCIAHFPVCLRGALCPKMSAAPPLPRHSRTMTSYLGLLPRTINFVFPLQSRRRRHLRSRHACGIFSKSCHATLDARVITSPRPSPKERGREERAAFPGGSISFVRVLSSKLRTRARRRYIVREYGDATLQKPWCPPLILLRTQTAKECFCHSTYANADAGRQRSRPTDTPMRA